MLKEREKEGREEEEEGERRRTDGQKGRDRVRNGRGRKRENPCRGAIRESMGKMRRAARAHAYTHRSVRNQFGMHYAVRGRLASAYPGTAPGI